ncbi:MAG TPA: S8 family serine peptidase, partial [Clostridia bacterium]|nr:S8 family serine peptidase [Clostridia bacterium]
LKDLSKLDLTDRFNDLIHATFDSDTKWPDKLPKGYDPRNIMKTGMNPGLGIRKLQSEGIDGRGVNIAIIDQGLLIEHIEYKDRIKFYDEVHCNDQTASMHAPFMVSLAVGKNIGVAPGSNLYAIGCTNFDFSDGKMIIDFTYVAKAIDRVIEINKTLPGGNKIRALSMSMSCCPGNKGYKELSGAIERAKKQGIFVISAGIFESYDHKMWYHGLDRDNLGDPDKISSYSVIPWDKWTPMIKHVDGTDIYYEQEFDKYNPAEILLVPMCSRTGASPTGVDKYAFYDQGGWSSVEPFLTGLYAMACQVKPDITPELFWKTALETGDRDEIKKGEKIYIGKIINPVKLIETIKQK